MSASQGEAALNEPDTERTWKKHRRRAKVAFGAGVASIFVYAGVFAALSLPNGFLFPLVIISMAWLIVWERLLTSTRRMRPILAVYPWQRYTDVARVAPNGTIYFELPNPDSEKGSVSIRLQAASVNPWAKMVRSESVSEVWFAGDPRFAGVLALPGPRRFTLTRQPVAFDSSAVFQDRNKVSPQALENARAARVLLDEGLAAQVRRDQ